jgi:Leucine-rich repeat (LRR) protein
MHGVIPGRIGELINLRLPYLRDNQKIQNLPANITNLKHFKNLILDNTGLDKVPPHIGEIHSLELLDISIWGLKEVPQCT